MSPESLIARPSTTRACSVYVVHNRDVIRNGHRFPPPVFSVRQTMGYDMIFVVTLPSFQPSHI